MWHVYTGTLYLWLRLLRISSIPSQATPTVESPTAAYCLCKTSSISPATLPVSHWDHSGRISALVLPIMSLQVPPESGLFERNQEKDCIEPQKSSDVFRFVLHIDHGTMYDYVSQSCCKLRNIAFWWSKQHLVWSVREESHLFSIVAVNHKSLQRRPQSELLNRSINSVDVDMILWFYEHIFGNKANSGKLTLSSICPSYESMISSRIKYHEILPGEERHRPEST